MIPADKLADHFRVAIEKALRVLNGPEANLARQIISAQEILAEALTRTKERRIGERRDASRDRRQPAPVPERRVGPVTRRVKQNEPGTMISTRRRSLHPGRRTDDRILTFAGYTTVG